MSEDNDGNLVASAEEEVNLQDIIRDRKAERKQEAEEKRQMDLQRIRDMKSSIGIDPLQRFPKEVWEMIFNELDPEDRGNAIQIHPLFRDLLGKNKVRDILFPQVIKLKEFQERYDQEYEVGNYSKLRRVTKSMRNAVDGWTEDNLTKTIRQHGPVYSDGRLSNIYLLYESGFEREDVKSILASYDGRGRKRFFVKAITIHIPSSFFDGDYEQEIVDEQRRGDLVKEFKNNINSLLEWIGDQVLYLCFQFPRQRDREILVPLDEVYILLQHWTTMMPNLQWLKLELKQKPCHPKERSVSSSVLENYPFPHLPLLHRFTLKYGDIPGQPLAPQLCNSILDANQHVKILYLDEVDDSDLDLLPIHLIRSLPLTSFSVANAKRSHSDSSTLRFQTIQPLINLNWKLEGIKLELDDTAVELIDLLHLLQKFPTLEYVSLDFMSGVKIGYNGNFDYLRLPSLTDLKLSLTLPDINYESNVHVFFSLQFLIYCCKLKTLEWKLWFFDDCDLRKHLKSHENSGKTLDFRAGLKTLYDSNIWNVFPSLDYVQVDGWKRGGGDDHTASCHHEYKREDVTNGVSVGDFLRMHKCCRHDNQWQNCVMLYR